MTTQKQIIDFGKRLGDDFIRDILDRACPILGVFGNIEKQKLFQTEKPKIWSVCADFFDLRQSRINFWLFFDRPHLLK